MANTYTLIGIDGNAYSVMAYVIKAMKENNIPDCLIKSYQERAKSGDYNHLLRVSMDILNILNEKKDN